MPKLLALTTTVHCNAALMNDVPWLKLQRRKNYSKLNNEDILQEKNNAQRIRLFQKNWRGILRGYPKHHHWVSSSQPLLDFDGFSGMSQPLGRGGLEKNLASLQNSSLSLSHSMIRPSNHPRRSNHFSMTVSYCFFIFPNYWLHMATLSPISLRMI